MDLTFLGNEITARKIMSRKIKKYQKSQCFGDIT